jgi:heme A synthase
MRNNTGWASGARRSAGTNGLRRTGVNLIMLGAFALIAAGAASVVSHADLVMDTLMLVGIVACLVGWRIVVVARHRETPSDSAAS